MKDDDSQEFAKLFIQNWQENFAKLGADNLIMELFAANMHNMQQFYDKSAPATPGNASKSRANELKWSAIERRLDAIERQLADFKKSEARDKKNGAK